MSQVADNRAMSSSSHNYSYVLRKCLLLELNLLEISSVIVPPIRFLLPYMCIHLGKLTNRIIQATIKRFLPLPMKNRQGRTNLVALSIMQGTVDLKRRGEKCLCSGMFLLYQYIVVETNMTTHCEVHLKTEDRDIFLSLKLEIFT